MADAWRIVAQDGDDPETASYLIETGSDRARVFEGGTRIVFPEFSMHLILERGHWKEYTGSQDLLPRLFENSTIYNTVEEMIAGESAGQQDAAMTGRASADSGNPFKMRIVAQWSDDSLLIMTGPDRARVLSVASGTLCPESGMMPLIASGCWEDYTGQQGVLPSLLARVSAYDDWHELIAAQLERARIRWGHVPTEDEPATGEAQEKAKSRQT